MNIDQADEEEKEVQEEEKCFKKGDVALQLMIFTNFRAKSGGNSKYIATANDKSFANS